MRLVLDGITVSLPSTVQPFPARCWRANCSATKRAPSRALGRRRKGDFNQPMGNALFRRDWRYAVGISAQALARPAGAGVRTIRQRTYGSRECSGSGGDQPGLAELVNKKLFRADLFYRLNVIPICLPPLRERVQDILPLTEFFVAKFAARLNKPIDSIPDQVVAVLKGTTGQEIFGNSKISLSVRCSFLPARAASAAGPETDGEAAFRERCTHSC